MAVSPPVATLPPENLANFLRHCVLFEDADDASLADAVQRLELVKFRKGDPIVLENEISDHVYFVYSGSVEVVKHVRELNQLTRVAVLEAGGQFSEFSVLNRANKGASVFALEDCELLRMSGENFLAILSRHPEVCTKLVRQVAFMTQHIQTSNLRIPYTQAESILMHPEIPKLLMPKSWRKWGAVPLGLRDRGLLVAIKDPQNREFFNFMKEQHPNLQIYVNIVSDEDFDTLETQLMGAYNEPFKPTPSPAKTVQVPLEGEPSVWLPKISAFSQLPAELIAQLTPHFTYENYQSGDVIYKKGVVSEKLYFLLSGRVEVYLPLDAPNAAVPIGEVTVGEYFSEVSLITQKPHTLSTRAAGPVKLAVLSKAVFDQLLATSQFTLPLGRDLVVQFQKISHSLSFKFFNSNEGMQAKELATLLPRSIVTQYGILPVRLKDNELTIGITNPESDTIYSVISRYLSDYRVTLEIIKTADFKKWSQELGDGGGDTTVGRANSANLARGSAVTTLNNIITEGYENRASDIHIEPQPEHLVVRYRVDGVLREHHQKLSRELGAEVINRLKVVAQMDSTVKFTPQDGQMKMELQGFTAMARISTMPTKHGENAVLRLIRERSSVPPLATLAPDRKVVNLFREVVHSTQGVFLVTGPTGSGKSTTLYSLLKELNRVDINIVSLEDPVEMEIAGTTQVEVNEKVGLTFAKALRSTLRQDPNVIMVGEIRDEESAKIAFHAAATGHLVISTLHTNDALGVIPRLLELGVGPGVMAASLIGASAQRLVRHICEKCRETRPATHAEQEILQSALKLDSPPSEVACGKGCNHCGKTGYHGRLPIFEIWKMNKSLEDLIVHGANLEKISEEFHAHEFESLKQFALKMVLNGLTTFEEVVRAVGGLHLETREELRSAS